MINGIVFLFVSCAIYFILFYSLFKIEINERPLIYRFGEALNLKGGNTYQKFADFNPREKYDIVVIGSSHAYRSYDPRLFKENGINMFNLGTSAQTMVNSYFIAEGYIRSNTCKLVILDIFDGALIASETESSADLIQNISDDDVAFQLALHLREPRAINMYLLRMMNTNRKPFYYDTNYVANGYSENNNTVKGKLNYSFYRKKEISAVQLEYFEKLLQYFKLHNIPYIIIDGPLPKTWDFKGHQKFKKKVMTIVERYQSTFIDYSSKLRLDEKKYFYDAHHLNQEGVNIYNRQLLYDLDTLFKKL